MKLLKKNDIIIIALLLILCGALLIPRFLFSEKLTASIYSGGKVVQEIELSQVREDFSVKLETSPSVTISVSHNSICFSHADCKDKLCVNTGTLTSSGQSAACLPAGVVITLHGSKQNHDMMTY